MMGKLYAVGFGPGGYEHMTAKAIDVIKQRRWIVAVWQLILLQKGKR